MAVDIKFLKENGLLEEYQRFHKNVLNEFTFLDNSKDLLLDDDNDVNDTPHPGSDLPAGGGNDEQGNGETPNGGAIDGNGPDNTPDTNDGNMPMDNNETPADDMNNGNEGGAPEEGNEEFGEEVGDEMPMDGGEDGSDNQVNPDDTVIDVTDLTQKADEVDTNVNELGQQLTDMITQLISRCDDLEQKVTSETAELADEIKRRNPTPIEKLNLRARNNYPFNQTVDDYWNQKKGSNYDQDVEEEQKELVLNDNEIPGLSNTQFRQSLYNESELNVPTDLQEVLK